MIFYFFCIFLFSTIVNVNERHIYILEATRVNIARTHLPTTRWIFVSNCSLLHTFYFSLIAIFNVAHHQPIWLFLEKREKWGIVNGQVSLTLAKTSGIQANSFVLKRKRINSVIGVIFGTLPKVLIGNILDLHQHLLSH